MQSVYLQLLELSYNARRQSNPEDSSNENLTDKK